MPLTIEQAQHAGALAHELKTLQDNIPLVQAAIAGNLQIISMQAQTTGGSMSLTNTLSVVDTQTLLNAILNIAQGRIDAITAALDAM